MLSIHAMGAAITGIPELNIEKPEAAALAEAASEVLRFYPTAIDEKTTAWVNLGIVCIGTYGTRAMAYNNRLKSEEAAKRPKLPNPAAPATPANGAAGMGPFGVYASHTAIPPTD